MAYALSLPFQHLPLAWGVLLAIAFVIICLMLVWTTTLFVRGIESKVEEGDPDPAVTDSLTWVFLVPALNEELTIRDSVDRLVGLDLDRMHVVVINDGSDDATAQLLAAVDNPRLHVIERAPPNARQGKAAALNDAYRRLGEVLDHGVSRDQVIVTVVDADGRLAADAPTYAAVQFAEPRVGGVQSLVRIYNRRGLLTWLQDVEFSVYGCLYQEGRNLWGTAGMGGNGQFNRLSSLDGVADESGPWRDRLTEDQDLGLRLIAAGWLGRQELRSVVDQQGLSNLRRLFRQRTRWSQGNLQAMSLIGLVWRGEMTFSARIEQIAYLLLPVWHGFIGVSLVVAIVLGLTGKAVVYAGTGWQIAFFYVLGFGGVIMGCLARGLGRGPKAILTAVLVAQVYALYTWMLWPLLLRATARQLTDRSDWAKTAREPLTPLDDGGLAVSGGAAALSAPRPGPRQTPGSRRDR